MIDPENPVVQLCQQGMAAETQGRLDEARALFLRAWDARHNAYEGCIAAHYVARHQETPEDALFWNQRALELAAEVEQAGDEDEAVRDFYPSLYLNLGWSYETLGDPARARACYQHAAERLRSLPAGPYRDMVQGGIQNGLARTEEKKPGD